MESLKVFDEFKFSDVDEDWVKSIWDSEFLTYNEPPDEYLMFLESEDMRLLLHESCAAVKICLTELNNKKQSEQNCLEMSWNTLITLDVKVRPLLATLGYIMKSGQNKEADQDLRQSCLYATSLYFVLLGIPGSNAFNVFHPNLYQRAIATLKISEYLVPLAKKRNKSVTLDSFNFNIESPNESGLTPTERNALLEDLHNIVCSFTIMIKSFWFKDHVQSLDITVHGLLELTKVESDGVERYFQDGQRGTLETSLSQNAYEALEKLCDNRHGPVNVTVTYIAKHILPRLLCSHTDVQTKFTINLREAAIYFLERLLNMHERDATSALITLIEHLMLKCPDRLEARQKQAAILIKLLCVCKENIILEAIKNVVFLSHHAKIPCRVFAQEIIGKFFTESFFKDCNLLENLKIKIKRVFLAVVLNKCMDCSSMVRGKAMAIVAEFTDNNVHEMILRALFENSKANQTFPTFDELKKALLENIDPLPGSNSLIAMLKDSVEDERALVRKSALQIFKNLTMMFPVLLSTVIPIMSRCCRDPTLTVRRFAVQTLSQLLQQFPDDSELLGEWVQTVIPQIFDIEIKVQDKVLEYLQELLLNRIKDVSIYIDNGTNSLPWRILTTLTRMRMREHLSKACSLWVKNGVLTRPIMTNIQSHIGTSNNVAAWVFLAALAENTKLPNLDKYISDYKELLKKNDFHTSLVLEVLRFSWTSVDREVLISLHAYLYDCLQQFEINCLLISKCLDIIYTAIEYLHPNNSSDVIETLMLNLKRLSESEINKILKSENLAAEAAPNYLKAMFTLGHVTLFCTSKISPLTLRILEGVLLEWETLPEAIKEIEELRASVVVILGQQAMRDREIAQEVIPIFGRLMREETNLTSDIQIAVKINSAKALADICVRFTALVEPYLSDMCVSMKDPSPHVREAIIVIFIQLLLEDFIKVKGSFFFHILTMLSDSDDMIRELTVFLIEEKLLVKNKTLISQQFLESIYHYNDYKPQHKFYRRKMRDKEKKALTLPGKRNEDKRRIIYDFMLEHLDPPGKIKSLVKITSQILGGVCIDLVDLRKEEGVCVLKDALYIISNDRLQPSPVNKNGDDDSQEQDETTDQIITPTTNAINIIAEGMKKHGLDILLPTLVKLQKKLSIVSSQLENDVKRLLVKTYSEYNKEQLSNILSEYPTLDKEVEQFRRQVGVISSDDENSNDEGSLPSEIFNQTNSHKHSVLKECNMTPRVVLQRLSALDMSNWTSPSTITNAPFLSPSSTNSWSSLTIRCPTPTSRLNAIAKQGPSTSTPKSCRSTKSYNNDGHVPKSRRLSALLRDSKISSCSRYDTAKKSLSQVEEDSESD